MFESKLFCEAVRRETLNYQILQPENRNLIDKNATSFFGSYQAVCELTEDGLLFHYPQSDQLFPEPPLIRKQYIDLNDFDYIGFQNTHRYDKRNTETKTVGFFLKDVKFEHVCYRPWDYIGRLMQYRQTLTPDISCYTDMPITDQWRNTYWNRLIGAYWQYCGLTVIPAVSWSDERSFEFSFSGLEKGSIVAVSTNGTGAVRSRFMTGFKELCARIKPERVICYCTPYTEMHNYAKILYLEHEGNKKRRLARWLPVPEQRTFQFN